MKYLVEETVQFQRGPNEFDASSPEEAVRVANVAWFGENAEPSEDEEYVVRELGETYDVTIEVTRKLKTKKRR